MDDVNIYTWMIQDTLWATLTSNSSHSKHLVKSITYMKRGARMRINVLGHCDYWVVMQ
jgi:hypothetical protein